MIKNEGSREGYLEACTTFLKDLDTDTVKDMYSWILYNWRKRFDTDALETELEELTKREDQEEQPINRETQLRSVCCQLLRADGFWTKEASNAIYECVVEHWDRIAGPD